MNTDRHRLETKSYSVLFGMSGGLTLKWFYLCKFVFICGKLKGLNEIMWI